MAILWVMADLSFKMFRWFYSEGGKGSSGLESGLSSQVLPRTLRRALRIARRQETVFRARTAHPGMAAEISREALGHMAGRAQNRHIAAERIAEHIFKPGQMPAAKHSGLGLGHSFQQCGGMAPDHVSR